MLSLSWVLRANFGVTSSVEGHGLCGVGRAPLDSRNHGHRSWIEDVSARS